MREGSRNSILTAYDVGVLILSVVLGLTMAAHGYNKCVGGGRLPGTAGWFESIGMKPGMFPRANRGHHRDGRGGRGWRWACSPRCPPPASSR